MAVVFSNSLPELLEMQVSPIYYHTVGKDFQDYRPENTEPWKW